MQLPIPPSPPLVPPWAVEAAEERQGFYPGERPKAIFAGLLTACGEGVEPPTGFIDPNYPHGWRWIPLHTSVRPDFRVWLEERGASPEMVELGDEVVRQYYHLYRYWHAVYRRKAWWHDLHGLPVCEVTIEERIELEAWASIHGYPDPKYAEFQMKGMLRWFHHRPRTRKAR